MHLCVQLILIFIRAACETAKMTSVATGQTKVDIYSLKILKARYVETLNVIMCVNDMVV